jgi:hypothetical protein
LAPPHGLEGFFLARLSDPSLLCDCDAVGQRLHDGIAHSRAERGVDLGDAPGLARGADDRIRSANTATLVAPKALLGIAAAGKARAEHDGILECLRRSLAEVGLHRVRGVAE